MSNEVRVNNKLSARFAYHFKVRLLILPQRIYREVSQAVHTQSVIHPLMAGESYQVLIHTANNPPVVIDASRPFIVAQGRTGATIDITDALISQLFHINYGCPPVPPCPRSWYSTVDPDDLNNYPQGVQAGQLGVQLSQPLTGLPSGSLPSGFQAYGSQASTFNNDLYPSFMGL